MKTKKIGKIGWVLIGLAVIGVAAAYPVWRVRQSIRSIAEV